LHGLCNRAELRSALSALVQCCGFPVIRSRSSGHSPQSKAQPTASPRVGSNRVPPLLGLGHCLDLDWVGGSLNWHLLVSHTNCYSHWVGCNSLYRSWVPPALPPVLGNDFCLNWVRWPPSPARGRGDRTVTGHDLLLCGYWHRLAAQKQHQVLCTATGSGLFNTPRQALNSTYLQLHLVTVTFCSLWLWYFNLGWWHSHFYRLWGIGGCTGEGAGACTHWVRCALNDSRISSGFNIHCVRAQVLTYLLVPATTACTGSGSSSFLCLHFNQVSAVMRISIVGG